MGICLLFFLSLLSLSPPLLGFGTVRFGTEDDDGERFVSVEVGASGISGTFFPLVATRPLSAGFSSYGTTSGGAAQAWCPIDDGPADNRSRNHVFVRYSSLVPSLSSSTRAVLRVALTVDNSGDRVERASLYAASSLEDGGGHTVVGKYGGVFALEEKRDRVFLTFGMQALCNEGAINCNELFEDGEVNDSASTRLYFFLAPEDEYRVGSTVSNLDDDINGGGVYLNLYLSDRAIDEDENDRSVSVTGVNPGDEQLLVSYERSPINDFLDMRLIYQTRALNEDDSTVGHYLSQGVEYDVAEDIPADHREGVIRARGLTNNREYYIWAVAVNRYLMASRISDQRTGMPLQAAEILTGEGESPCYLLTAGFQENHLVLRYFRWIKDNILAHFSLGQDLIRLYYTTAPTYALRVYEHPLLAFFVRFGAICLFFFLNLSLTGLGLYLILRGIRWVYPPGG